MAGRRIVDGAEAESGGLLEDAPPLQPSPQPSASVITRVLVAPSDSPPSRAAAASTLSADLSQLRRANEEQHDLDSGAVLVVRGRGARAALAAVLYRLRRAVGGGRSPHRRAVTLLATCFSVVEASLLVVLSLATSVNKDLGEFSSGSLYVSYTACSLLAPAVVGALGVKRGLVLGLSGFCLFIAANAYPVFATLVPAAILCGAAGSFLWTAQGTYVTRRALLHARALAADGSAAPSPAAGGGDDFSGPAHTAAAAAAAGAVMAVAAVDEETTVLGQFNGLFMTVMETTIVAAQVGSSLYLSGGTLSSTSHPPSDRVASVFILFAAAAVLCTLALACALPPLPAVSAAASASEAAGTDEAAPVRATAADDDALLQHSGADEGSEDAGAGGGGGGGTSGEGAWQGQLLASLRILRDPRMALMVPSNMAFGFVQGFQQSTFSRFYVKPALGTGNIGAVAAVSALTGALVSFPLGWLSDRVGRRRVMFLGFAAHSSMALWLLLAWEDPANESAGDGSVARWAALLGLSALFGCGNAVWNSMNSSVFGDFFHSQPLPAFANLKSQSGLATALAYFAFPAIERAAQLWLVLAVLVCGFIGYMLAHRIHRQRRGARRSHRARPTSDA